MLLQGLKVVELATWVGEMAAFMPADPSAEKAA